jgi:catechol 2,3-dioxygenase-like lactoylglutathione lyase family enzyme
MKQGVWGLPLAAVMGFMVANVFDSGKQAPVEADQIELGNFSVSLAVKDLQASKAFYEKLGFRSFADTGASGYLIMQNSTATIGLFQGMFDKNILTFNPGWDRSAQTLQKFQDVREIQKKLGELGITPTVPADESTTGPASFVVADPDGNQILVDQHVSAPKK